MSRILTLVLLLIPTAAQADNWRQFVEQARLQHGPAGAKAARFLADNHPPRDTDIDLQLLTENLEYALRARSEFSWARSLTDLRFLNDVLPYASLDETREAWRKRLYDICRPIVKDCRTSSEAAQRLNRDLFNAVNVHYNTGRKKPNQSPSESIAQGRATCTGLSILLVDGCRSVGIPARIAGVAKWYGKEGNHTWVEIWDGDWKFAGADEYDRNGLNRAWFVIDAGNAVAGDPIHAVWATSFQKSTTHFPMSWNMGDTSVPGVDVTHRYARKNKTKAATATRYFRVWNKRNGERIVAEISLVNSGADSKSVKSKAGTSDLNDMPELAFHTDASHRIRIEHNGQARFMQVESPNVDKQTLDIYWNELPAGSGTPAKPVGNVGLTKQAAEQLIRKIGQERSRQIARDRAKELEDDAIQLDGKTLRLLTRTFGDAPSDGRSLWISMHGGGGAPAEVNDRQWKNQIRLYQPGEGIYIAPRAPSDTWNLWHQAHIDPLFDRLIETYVAARGVNPDKIYLLGYSAGGDGVFQLAPRMADRFAAASMMAGHPNETQPDGLRNLPFAIFMGAEDSAFNRNKVAREWGNKLATLKKGDPDGYPHRVTIYEGLGHWMKGKDAEVLPWMAKQTRDAWPGKIVWRQDDVTHTRFYWLRIRDEDATKGAVVQAAVDGQTIKINTKDLSQLTLRLRDTLIDLDQPIKVVANGKTVFEGKVARTEQAIRRSLLERNDAPAAATAELAVKW